MKITESQLERKAKAIITADSSFTNKKWEIVFEEVVIGTVTKLYVASGEYSAFDIDGNYIGTGNTIKEARIMVAERHIGFDNIEYKD